MKGLFFFLLPLSLWGTKYAGEALSFEFGARSAGMGGAFSAGYGDLSGINRNPAIINTLTGLNTNLAMGYAYQGLLRYGTFIAGYPLKDNLTLGWGMYFLQVPDILHTETSIPPDSVRSPGEIIIKDKFTFGTYSISFLVGRSIGSIDAGVKLKLLMEQALEQRAQGVGLDFGIGSWLNDRIRWGVGLLNFTGTYIQWTTGRKEVIVPSLNIGFLFKPLGFVQINQDIEIFFEGRKKSAFFSFWEMSFHPRIGVEYTPFPYLMFRAGFEESFPTLGVGIYPRIVSLDYALRYSFDLGPTHILSLVFNL